MAQFTDMDGGELTITVADLRELLSDYDDNAVIDIEGGSSYGMDFVVVSINGHEIAISE